MHSCGRGGSACATPVIRPALNPSAVRIAPACADRNAAIVMVNSRSYFVVTSPPLARCEAYAKCMRLSVGRHAEFAQGIHKKHAISVPIGRSEANGLNDRKPTRPVPCLLVGRSCVPGGRNRQPCFAIRPLACRGTTRAQSRHRVGGVLDYVPHLRCVALSPLQVHHVGR